MDDELELERLEAAEAKDDAVSKRLNQAAKWLSLALMVGCLFLALSGCAEHVSVDWTFT